VSSRFSFRLARLLRLRSVFEQEARAVFGAAEGAAVEAEAEAERQAAALHSALRESAALSGPGQIEPEAVLSAEVAEAARRARLLHERRRADTLRFQADRLRDAWLARRVDHESVQRLEERARGRWREELETSENSALDEVAMTRAFSRPADSVHRETDSPSAAPQRTADPKSSGASDLRSRRGHGG
jgi:flagellar export protein FliJ